ncbi:IS4 family transposase [Streptomyces sp. CA-106110]|uniref:IS4 family transposase n=1 Tax=Streptomyces sp. CA-106110 TaxID=3240044 RepID=UPI003D8F1536
MLIVSQGGGAGGRLPEWISIGLLAGSVPRDVIDDAVRAFGRQARRSDGKLPPHVVVYLVMALALFADDDYEEAITRLSEPLERWGCWDRAWEVPTTSAITQARKRLGSEPLAEIFDRITEPVAEQLTRGAWLGPRRLVSIDGMEWDLPDTESNAEAFGRSGTAANPSAFPKARVLTLVETGSRAPIGAAIGPIAGKRAGEQTLAFQLFERLEEDMLLLADRGFFGFEQWCAAAGTGADLLWRVGDTLTLPLVADLPDGSYLSLVYSPRLNTAARGRLLEDARAGREVDPAAARVVRVVEYEVPDRGTDAERELVCLITTITDHANAPAPLLAHAYHQRWEHEQSNDDLKTALRGPGRILRSKSPDLVRQELYGYLLTHYAISALICRAATEADIDPDRVKFTRTLRIVRRRVADPAAISP